MAEYDAATQVRSAISTEEGDSSSIAYGKKLLVGRGAADKLSDGRKAWRFGFTTLDGKPSKICMWVWLVKTTAGEEDYRYTVAVCPRVDSQTSA